MRKMMLCLLAGLAGCGSSLSTEAANLASASVPETLAAQTVAAETVAAQTVAARTVAGLTVDLVPGWNPVAFQCATLTEVQATGAAGVAWYSEGQFHTGSLTLAELTSGQGASRGLWVHALTAGRLTYSGDDAPAAPLNLSAGWNLVSFRSTASLGAADLTCRRNGAVVALAGAVLIYEIGPDRSSRLVDLSAGDRLLPGRPAWVYASQPLTLQVTGPGVTAPSVAASPASAAGDLARVASRFSNGVSVAVGATEITLSSLSQPDHRSVYWQPGHPLHEVYANPAFRQNPHTIAAIPLTIRIPRFPREAASKTATPVGPIGMCRTGVPFYNQYAANFSPLTMELPTMDQGNGHPSPMNQYHYHLEPLLLTAAQGKADFLGVLADGFPVYGPAEGGRTLQSSDLDAYHGHFGPTAEFPEGIYHYHFTSSDPYLNGGSYFGTPGTVSR